MHVNEEARDNRSGGFKFAETERERERERESMHGVWRASAGK
jgi:hypothetical protein